MDFNKRATDSIPSRALYESYFIADNQGILKNKNKRREAGDGTTLDEFVDELRDDQVLLVLRADQVRDIFK